MLGVRPKTKTKISYTVGLRDELGEEHMRMIFAADEATARKRAVERARISLGQTLRDRLYVGTK